MATSLAIHAWTTEHELAWIDSRERSLSELEAIRRAVVYREYAPPCNKRLVLEALDWRIRLKRRAERSLGGGR